MTEPVSHWKSPGLYDQTIDDLVQVLCEVLPDAEPEDGFTRSCLLGISSGDHAVGDNFVSIGFKMALPDDDQEWSVAGWNMEQDCWEDARRFRVIGWQPLASL